MSSSSDAGRGAALVGLLSAVGGGVGSAVVSGFGEVLRLDVSRLLAALPLAGCLALVRTIRAERVAG